MTVDSGRETSSATVALRERLRAARGEITGVGSDIANVGAAVVELGQRHAALAQAEASASLSATIRSAIWAVVAAVVGLLTLVFLCTALMFGLAEVWPLWAAALATAGFLIVVLVAAAALLLRYVRQISLTPQRTIEALREDAGWLKALIKRRSA